MAKILLDYGKYSPGDVPAVSVHFENMRDIWKDKMQSLTNLVDSATDTAKFIEACGMLKDSINSSVSKAALGVLFFHLPTPRVCDSKVCMKLNVKIKANSI